MKALLSALLLASLTSVLNAQESAPLLAGTAKVEITPTAEQAVNLTGQPLQLRDPLFARVLVLKTPQTSIAIVSVDLIVFASKKVIDEAKAKYGLDHLILCATHTHAAPAPRGMLIKPPAAPDWTRSPKAPAEVIDWPGLSADPWYAATEAKVIAAIGQAMQHLFPARLAAGKGPFESAYMAHNRRLVRAGIVSAMWENPDRRPTKPVDPTVGVIRVEDMTGKVRAFAVQYACHPVTLMGASAVSRDYPGAMVDHIEQELGPDCIAMFLQGASGDLDPYDLHNLRGENRFNVAKQAGISLAKGALQIAQNLKPQSASAIQVKESLLTIPNRHGNLSTEVGLLTMAIGRDLALVAIPGEPFIQHQLDLTAQSPIANSFILGLAYHGKGTPFVVYIPTARAVKEGGYGASECSFLAPEAGEKLVAEAVAQLQDLASPPKALK
jgi:neutral ceramidase